MRFTLDGEAVTAGPGDTIWDVAKRAGTTIPHLCHTDAPGYRPDGKPSFLNTLLPDHPIAKGVPRNFQVAGTEMYNEPFHVPEPDIVVFEERWPTGEWFRSGCIWNLGDGKIFYFRPGHETFPVYKQEIPLRIVENAVRWLGAPGDSRHP